MQSNDRLPFVSIIVPAFNEEKRIGNAIQGLLSQTYPKDCYEVIVVNDGSTDNTKEIASRYPIKLISNLKNMGDSASRNIGAKNAKGEIIATTDADDIVDKYWIKNIIECYQKNFSDAVIGSSRLINEPNNWKLIILSELSIVLRGDKYTKNIYDNGGKLRSNMSIGNNQSFKKDIFFRIGGYDMGLKSGMDQDIIWRIERAGYRVHFAPNAIAYTRLRNSFSKFLSQSYNRSAGGIIIYFKHPTKIKSRYLFNVLYIPMIAASSVLYLLFSSDIFRYILILLLCMPMIFYALYSIKVLNKLSKKINITIIIIIGYLSFIVASFGLLKGIFIYSLKYKETLLSPGLIPDRCKLE